MGCYVSRFLQTHIHSYNSLLFVTYFASRLVFDCKCTCTRHGFRVLEHESRIMIILQERNTNISNIIKTWTEFCLTTVRHIYIYDSYPDVVCQFSQHFSSGPCTWWRSKNLCLHWISKFEKRSTMLSLSCKFICSRLCNHSINASVSLSKYLVSINLLRVDPLPCQIFEPSILIWYMYRKFFFSHLF